MLIIIGKEFENNSLNFLLVQDGLIPQINTRASIKCICFLDKFWKPGTEFVSTFDVACL